MRTVDLDVVYFVKDSSVNQELKYSLRSIEKNLAYRNVWLYGGKPDGLRDVHHVAVKQEGATKWDKVRNMFELACENQSLSSDFILFNDDFFVMSPTDDIPVLYRDTLVRHIVDLEMGIGNRMSKYSIRLRNALKFLRDNGVDDPKSYELHIPFIFNKAKLKEILRANPGIGVTRTLYGNYYDLGGRQAEDVKIYTLDKKPVPGKRFLSTDDGSFAGGAVGRYLRKQFPTPSQYEVQK